MTMQPLGSLKIPVHPDFDFDLPVDQQTFEYVNPVMVAYRQIYLANYAVDVTERTARLQNRLAILRNELSDVESELESVDQSILRRWPMATAESKSNKTIEAFLARMAVEHTIPERDTLKAKIRDLEKTIRIREAQYSGLKHIADMLKLISEHGRTYLAFAKHEENAQKR